MLDREIGLIQFYKRIIANAHDKKIPLLERLNYICIVSRNCDELFEIRIARLLKLNKENSHKLLPDGLTPKAALALIRNHIDNLYKEIYDLYNNEIIPQLKRQHIYIADNKNLTANELKWSKDYFIEALKPVLTPIGIDPAHPFPKIPNKNLHFAVSLDGIDQFGRESKIAIVEAPRILPRVIKIPADIALKPNTFILLQDIIKLHIGDFFHGLTVIGCYPFRVTRATDLSLTANIKNLRFAVTQEINKRRYAECSRLELDIHDETPNQDFINILLKQFNLTLQDMYLVPGPVNLSRLGEIAEMVERPELRFPKFVPGTPQELTKTPNIFEAMSKSDILIHTPYQAFDPVLELTERAIHDPDVLAIKMTVYRTGQDSKLVQNLIKAAHAGKQVTASIELFARYDEEINVGLSTQLEEAGAHVVYGVMRYKVHAKMLLVVRKEGKILKEYAHLGTGNYHQTTAQTYTDFNLLTTNPKITKDVDNLFAQITGIGQAATLNILYQSPFTLFDMLIFRIKEETNIALNGKPAQIIAKMNSLLEPQIIEHLYTASKAGVKIQLIVRGACALIPKVSGVSDNIEVISIVGRFLEHHRVFYFYNSGAEDVYISSADWMDRNFFRRVETCIPILDNKVKTRIIEEGLKVYINDNVDSWVMDSSGNYTKKDNNNSHTSPKRSAQQILIQKLGKMID